MILDNFFLLPAFFLGLLFVHMGYGPNTKEFWIGLLLSISYGLTFKVFA